MKFRSDKNARRGSRRPEDLKLTGRVYASVEDLMKGEGIPLAIQKEVLESKKSRAIATSLALLRHQKGLPKKRWRIGLG